MALKTARLLLALSLLTIIVLMIKKPQPLAARSQSPAALSQNADAFQTKLGDLQAAHERGESGAEAHITSEEVRAAVTVANSPSAASLNSQNSPNAVADLNNPTTLSPEQVAVKDQQVEFDGDQVKGQFTTQIAGKDVVVSLSGHLGSKDGYAEFEPTSFQVGSLPVPLSLVQEQLRKKLTSDPATRDKLKLPDYVSEVKIENGQLVVVEK